jgi:hypothetical protein
MYLQDFEASGALTHDAAERISWKTAEFDAKIVMAVNRRRFDVHCLPLCWDELDIHRGTPLSITVEGGTRDDEERRALVAMVDYFQSMTTPEPPVTRRRRRFVFGSRTR